jgi:hypothetical protein
MTSAERWLAAMWPLVSARLSPPPARVVDIGCGPHGGFVPFMRASGYEAVGVDSEAPDWEKFDDATAGWCFQWLGDEANWLHRRRDEWTASGQEWQDYLLTWATREGVHRADDIVRLLDERFGNQLLASGPYFFPDLENTTDADEQAAIDADDIQASRIDWVGLH